jgi:hypothetical protein
MFGLRKKDFLGDTQGMSKKEKRDLAGLKRGEDLTLYDLQQREADEIKDSISYVVDSEHSAPNLGEEIQETFDVSSDRKAVARSLERNQNDEHYYGHARGGNSKPKRTDHHLGQDRLADHQREQEILDDIDKMAA